MVWAVGVVLEADIGTLLTIIYLDGHLCSLIISTLCFVIDYDYSYIIFVSMIMIKMKSGVNDYDYNFMICYS